MTEHTQEQHARWLGLLEERGYNTFPKMPSFTFQMKKEQYFDLCATITAEAVAAERSRVAERAEMTDEQIYQLWNSIPQSSPFATILPFARALIADAIACAALAAIRDRAISLEASP
jgi:preprotein translocase subunit SecB